MSATGSLAERWDVYWDLGVWLPTVCIAALLGLGLGLGCAFGVTRLVRGLLFGVGSTDPATFTTGIVVLLAAAILAAYLPIRRAVRVDPMISLRNE